VFHAGSRQLQDMHDARRLADRLEERSRRALSDEDRAFIAARDMMFVATADADGHPTCSYKGGEPGFVRVLDEATLAWDDRDGNGMFLSLGNMMVNPWVGLLFIDWDRPSRLRVHGRATVVEGHGEIRVAVERVFPNCPRYIHRMALVERSRFVAPDPPEPAWKSADWARDVLPSPPAGRPDPDR
jgi:predicted pyridoxine 5'-phosphate oxidase superfamily flavin-nucleotide-binding protein